MRGSLSLQGLSYDFVKNEKNNSTRVHEYEDEIHQEMKWF